MFGRFKCPVCRTATAAKEISYVSTVKTQQEESQESEIKIKVGTNFEYDISVLNNILSSVSLDFEKGNNNLRLFATRDLQPNGFSRRHCVTTAVHTYVLKPKAAK